MNVTAYERNGVEELRASAMSFQLRALLLDKEIAELDRCPRRHRTAPESQPQASIPKA